MNILIVLIYLCIVMAMLCPVGMIIGYKKPDFFKSLFKKHCHKRFIVRTFVIAEIFFVCLGSIVIVTNRHNIITRLPGAKIDYNNLSKAFKDLNIPKTTSPSSGELIYKFLSETKKDDGSTRYIYYTPETLDDRLIELNDQVVSDLRDSGKITDDTKAYYIDYFSNESIAKTYYQKMASKTTASAEKLSLMVVYTASMQYYKPLGINKLVRMPASKVLKSY